jgi:putative peptide zinc metalloprotease protein
VKQSFTGERERAADRHGQAGSVRSAAFAQESRLVEPGDGTRPALVDGVELIGEYEDSGYKEPPSIARRPDGQVVQLTPLLYSVASRVDGSSDYGAIADDVSRELGRAVSADNVRFLVEEKLHPLGIVTGPHGEEPKARKADPLLGLRFRTAVVPEWLSHALATVFKPLFFGPLVIAVLAGFAVFDAWLFLDHGVAQGMRETLYQPQYVLALLGLVVASAAFHEMGHAAGCAYGGGRPGRMGCGLYLAWPAFYTDVTDAYRLSRRARLRTDLGGVYFNVVFILGLGAAYAATGAEWLLLVVVVQHIEIAHQLLPVVRLDGYYIVADLTGVPDLFARIGPILRSMVPWRRGDERVHELKRWVRVAVTAWVLVVVPLLLFQLVMILAHLPRILGTAWDSMGDQLGRIGDAFDDGDTLGGVTGILQALVLALPVTAIVLMLLRLATRTAQGVWRRTAGRPLARSGALLVGAGIVAALAFAWVPRENYEPIREGERGTLFEGVSAVRRLPHGDGPLESHRRAAAVADTQPADQQAPSDTEPDTSTTTTTSTTVLDEDEDERPAVRPTSTSTSSTSTSSTSTTSTTVERSSTTTSTTEATP